MRWSEDANANVSVSHGRFSVSKGRSHIEWRGARVFLDVLEELAEILVHVEQRALAAPAKAQREENRLVLAIELVDVTHLFRDGLVDRRGAELLYLPLAAGNDVVGI